jgi:TrmH family RNA methyltransferase
VEYLIQKYIISMVTKNQIKLITSLQQKKYRTAHELFFAEGVKVIQELLQSNFELEHLYMTDALFDGVDLDKGLIVALDDIRDPGNLGTILRLCDWFGISQLLCSEQTVDIYNPKVVQATMGSIARVNVNYVDLNAFIQKTTLPVFGTFMDGKNIYKEPLPKEGIIVMGNEANGISESIEKSIKNRLTIPRFGDLQQTESLNVATATAIILSEFRREN